MQTCHNDIHVKFINVHLGMICIYKLNSCGLSFINNVQYENVHWEYYKHCFEDKDQ